MRDSIYTVLWVAIITGVAVIAWLGDKSLIHPPGSSVGGHAWQLWTIRFASSAAALIGWIYAWKALRVSSVRRSMTPTRYDLSTVLNKGHDRWRTRIQADGPYEITVSGSAEGSACFEIRCSLMDSATGKSVDACTIKKTKWIDERECELQDIGKGIRTRDLALRANEPLHNEVKINIECIAWGGALRLEELQ